MEAFLEMVQPSPRYLPKNVSGNASSSDLKRSCGIHSLKYQEGQTSDKLLSFVYCIFAGAHHLEPVTTLLPCIPVTAFSQTDLFLV